MKKHHIPGAIDLMRIPPGDRGPLLRSLVRYHADRLAMMEARGSKHGTTRHRKLLGQVRCAARLIGAESLLS